MDKIFYDFKLWEQNQFILPFVYTNRVNWNTLLSMLAKLSININSAQLFQPNLKKVITVETQFSNLSLLWNESLMRFKLQYPERQWFAKFLKTFPLNSTYLSEPLILDLDSDLTLKPSRFVGGVSRLKDASKFLYSWRKEKNILFDKICGGYTHNVYTYNVSFGVYLNYSYNRPTFLYHCYGLYSPLVPAYSNLHTGLNFWLYYRNFWILFKFWILFIIIFFITVCVYLRFLWKILDYRLSCVSSWD
jgi:hypothetical protein